MITCMLSSLLSGDSQCSPGSASGLGLLSSDLESPEMSQPSVTLNLLHSFQIFSEFGVQGVGNELSVPSVSDISLSVQEPLGNVVVYMKVWLYKEGGRGSDLPVGLAMMSLTFSISASVSSPALQARMGQICSKSMIKNVLTFYLSQFVRPWESS